MTGGAAAAAAMFATAAISAQEPLPHTLWSWGARLRAAAGCPLLRCRCWIGLRDDRASTKEKVSGAAETGIALTHLLSVFFGPTAKLLGFKLVKASRGIDNDPGFQADATAAAVVMEEARGKASLGDERTVHCCGNFSSSRGWSLVHISVGRKYIYIAHTVHRALRKLGAKFIRLLFYQRTGLLQDIQASSATLPQQCLPLPAPSTSALTPVPLAIETLPISHLAVPPSSTPTFPSPRESDTIPSRQYTAKWIIPVGLIIDIKSEEEVNWGVNFGSGAA
ncbi:hypothetical protein C8R47DRAFT_1071678 [Mycena vitilis]|nr:hypothetical protein C8R47DRAFT_1071678 [Mycena vitilis]